MPLQQPFAGPVPVGSRSSLEEETQMENSKDDHVPNDDPAAKQRGQENRKVMDEVPEHGTDPLHEGP